MNIDPLAEDYYYQSTYAFAANNPVFYIDYNGEGVFTKYIGEDGMQLLETNDGSDDVITISDDYASEFVELTSLTSQNDLDSQGFNDAIKGKVLATEGVDVIGFLGEFSTQTARQAGIEYLQDQTVANGLKADLLHALGQWTKPENLIGVASVLTAMRPNVKTNYSNLKEPRNVGPGKKFTQAQKARILEANRQANGGVLRSDLSRQQLANPVQSQRGVPATMHQAEIDHIKPRSRGGTNSNSNAQVLSKKENINKSDN